ncbi:hypothetical protein NKG94_00710 [Micromonospora sp. M12]
MLLIVTAWRHPDMGDAKSEHSDLPCLIGLKSGKCGGPSINGSGRRQAA